MDNATIRSGRDIIHDYIPKVKDAKYKQAVEYLDSINGFDYATADQKYHDAWKTIKDNVFLMNGRYNRVGKEMLDKYKSLGYDAVEDPYLYTWSQDNPAYQTFGPFTNKPITILNEDKFKVVSSEDAPGFSGIYGRPYTKKETKKYAKNISKKYNRGK